MSTALPYDELPGAISKRALLEHMKLWNGYTAAYGRVQASLTSVVLPEKHTPDDPFRIGLNIRGYAADGDRLHELFFRNLVRNQNRTMILLAIERGVEYNRWCTGSGSPWLLAIEGAVERKWGDMDGFRQVMRSATLAARGWSILTWDRVEKDLRVITLDGHDQGLVVGCEPLLVLDAFEHAYWMDHGTDKGGYFDALWTYVDWFQVNRRFNACQER